jgi:hypothetical protein
MSRCLLHRYPELTSKELPQSCLPAPPDGRGFARPKRCSPKSRFRSPASLASPPAADPYRWAVIDLDYHDANLELSNLADKSIFVRRMVMGNKSINSKLLLGVLILWMVISQLLGLYSVRYPVAYFIESAIPFFCIPPLLVMGLGIASWVFFIKKQYKQSTLTTSLIFILALFLVYFYWGAQVGG